MPVAAFVPEPRRCPACRGSGLRFSVATGDFARCVVCGGTGEVTLTESTALIVESRRLRGRPGPIARHIVLRQEVEGGPMEVVDAWDGPLRCTATAEDLGLVRFESVVEEVADAG